MSVKRIYGGLRDGSRAAVSRLGQPLGLLWLLALGIAAGCGEVTPTVVVVPPGACTGIDATGREYTTACVCTQRSKISDDGQLVETVVQCEPKARQQECAYRNEQGALDVTICLCEPAPAAAWSPTAQIQCQPTDKAPREPTPEPGPEPEPGDGEADSDGDGDSIRDLPETGAASEPASSGREGADDGVSPPPDDAQPVTQPETTGEVAPAESSTAFGEQLCIAWLEKRTEHYLDEDDAVDRVELVAVESVTAPVGTEIVTTTTRTDTDGDGWEDEVRTERSRRWPLPEGGYGVEHIVEVDEDGDGAPSIIERTLTYYNRAELVTAETYTRTERRRVVAWRRTNNRYRGEHPLELSTVTWSRASGGVTEWTRYEWLPSGLLRVRLHRRFDGLGQVLLEEREQYRYDSAGRGEVSWEYIRDTVPGEPYDHYERRETSYQDDGSKSVYYRLARADGSREERRISFAADGSRSESVQRWDARGNYRTWNRRYNTYGAKVYERSESLDVDGEEDTFVYRATYDDVVRRPIEWEVQAWDNEGYRSERVGSARFDAAGHQLEWRERSSSRHASGYRYRENDWETRTYDENGMLVRQEEYEEDYTYDPDDGSDRRQWRAVRSYAYDEQGRRASETHEFYRDGDPDGRIDVVYQYTNEPDLDEVVKTKYDRYGRGQGCVVYTTREQRQDNTITYFSEQRWYPSLNCKGPSAYSATERIESEGYRYREIRRDGDIFDTPGDGHPDYREVSEWQQLDGQRQRSLEAKDTDGNGRWNERVETSIEERAQCR